MYHFSSEIILGIFYRHLAIFFWSHSIRRRIIVWLVSSFTGFDNNKQKNADSKQFKQLYSDTSAYIECSLSIRIKPFWPSWRPASCCLGFCSTSFCDLCKSHSAKCGQYLKTGQLKLIVLH